MKIFLLLLLNDNNNIGIYICFRNNLKIQSKTTKTINNPNVIIHLLIKKKLFLLQIHVKDIL